MQSSEEEARAAELLEKLLADSEFRASFRRDPAGACAAYGLPELVEEFFRGAGQGKALHTLEIRESRSSLAGALMAAASEGTGAAEQLRNLHEQHLHGAAHRVVGKALTAHQLSAVGEPSVRELADATGPSGGGAGQIADPQSVEAVLHNPGLALSPEAHAALVRGGADVRLVGVLDELSKDHNLRIGTLQAGPDGSGSFEILSVDGERVSQTNIAARDLANELASLDPTLRPAQIVTPWPIAGEGFSTSSAHEDRIQLVFGAAAAPANQSPPPPEPSTTPPAPSTTPPAPSTTPPAPSTTPPAPSTPPPAPSTPPPAPSTPPPEPSTTPPAPSTPPPAPSTTPPVSGSAPPSPPEPPPVDHQNTGTPPPPPAPSTPPPAPSTPPPAPATPPPAAPPPPTTPAPAAPAPSAAPAPEPSAPPVTPPVTPPAAPSTPPPEPATGTGVPPAQSHQSVVLGAVQGSAPAGHQTLSFQIADQQSAAYDPNAPGVLPDASDAYPGDNAPPQEIAAWMGRQAHKAGLPAELPIMAALTESGLKNDNYGDRDSLGFFQMRTSIWNQGEYAGYPDHPELQLKWFLNQALEVRRERIAAGDTSYGQDKSTWGDWVADVEQPAAEYRGRYATHLDEADQLLAEGGATGGVGAATGVDPGAVASALGGAAAGAGGSSVGLAALAVAEKYEGTPYHWGGNTPQTGFDCSGLVQWSYKQLGIDLPRVTTEQYQVGVHIPAVDQLRPGDIVFFQDSTGYIHHEGIYIGNHMFLHAPHTGDVVKVSSLDEPYYAQQFAGGSDVSGLAHGAVPPPDAGAVPTPPPPPAEPASPTAPAEPAAADAAPSGDGGAADDLLAAIDNPAQKSGGTRSTVQILPAVPDPNDQQAG